MWIYTQRKERGLSVIFITHNVHHVMAVADRYTVIRHGKRVGTYNQGEISFDDLSDLITVNGNASQPEAARETRSGCLFGSSVRKTGNFARNEYEECVFP